MTSARHETIVPEPGDYACLSVGGDGGKLIQAGEWLNGDSFDQYQHAFVYLGGMMVVEAEPGGAVAATIASYHPAGETLWSTGKIPLTPAQRTAICKAARSYIGTPYSWLDYAAIAAHRFHLPVPGLRSYVASTGHMICSTL